MFADAIQMFGGGQLTVTGPTATAGIFSTYPADHLSLWGGIVDQVSYTLPFLINLIYCNTSQEPDLNHFTLLLPLAQN